MLSSGTAPRRPYREKVTYLPTDDGGSKNKARIWSKEFVGKIRLHARDFRGRGHLVSGDNPEVGDGRSD